MHILYKRRALALNTILFFVAKAFMYNCHKGQTVGAQGLQHSLVSKGRRYNVVSFLNGDTPD